MATERVLKRSESAYKNMEAAARLLSAFSKNGYTYTVEDVYLDFGQDWMWTTITRPSEWGGVQVLSPREWQEIVLADSPSALAEAVEGVMDGKYFGDK